MMIHQYICCVIWYLFAMSTHDRILLPILVDELKFSGGSDNDAVFYQSGFVNKASMSRFSATTMP